MDRPAGLALRWVRAVLLAGISVLGGVVGHVAADGLLPGVAAMTSLTLAAVVAAAMLLGRPASTARVVVLLVAGQTLIHLVLTAAAGHRGDPVRTPAVTAPAPHVPDLAHAGPRVGSLQDQLYGHQPVVAELTVPVPVQHLLADFSGPNAVMALAHLLAAAVVGLWLAQGERALWTVLALTVAGVRELVHASVVGFFAVLRALGATLEAVYRLGAHSSDCRTERAPRLLELDRVLSRRGPPALLLA